MASSVRPLIGTDDLVWVHDYHLFPLGAELRRHRCANRIGFFLHIPWPAPELLRALPEAAALVRDLFAYDLVGFQTEESLARFRDFAATRCGAVAGRGGRLTLDGMTIRTLVCPIGIDAGGIARAAVAPPAQRAARRVRSAAAGRSVIMGVDRLDYTKGIEQRFAGYERWLAERPAGRGELLLLQVAPPSRIALPPYRNLHARLDAAARRINGAHADLMAPILYIPRGIERAAACGVYRASAVGLVTPLADGMNLVAKEYVAAQDPHDPGVLILSVHAGAAAQMHAALLVEPEDPRAIAAAIDRALAMPLVERIARWKALITGIQEQDLDWWQDRFLNALRATSPREVHVPFLCAPDPAMTPPARLYAVHR